MSELSAHAYAALFPLIEGAAFDELVADVAENGLRERIILLDGQILDGRNRYRAAVAAGLFEAAPARRALKLWFRDFIREEEGDPLAFVLSHNLHRRHLTTSQRAMIGAEIAGLRRGRPGENPPIGGFDVSEAAARLAVAERSIERARVVRDHGVPELSDAVRQGDVSISLAEQVSRLSPEEQRELIDSVDRKLLRQAMKDLRAESQDAKKLRRAERERELAPRIIAGAADLQALIESGQRFGVILADPEWKFDSWSDDTGMDRSPDNHYPTSSLDVIASRPVGQIAAENCLLLLWATAPMLPEAIEVMAGWGFVYKTHAIGRKDRIILGYWFRSRHEILLLGVRGAVPCPAMGEQWESVFDFPVTEHSAKPDFAHRFAERFFPSWPKIELNARETREGWFAWGAEAPAAGGEAIGSLGDAATDLPAISDDEAAGQDGLDEVDDYEPSGDDEDEVPPSPKRKGGKERATKPRDWEVERDARDARIADICGGLPEDHPSLIAAYGEAIDAHHDAVMREVADEAFAAHETMDAILLRANGCDPVGVRTHDAPMAVYRASWAPCGAVPKWGQVGQFIVEHRQVRAIISFGDHEGIHAADFNRPFPSSTGFHSIGARRESGMSVEDYGRAMIDAAIAYSPDGKKGKARRLVLPECAYRLDRGERGYLLSRERGVLVDPTAPPEGLDLDGLASILQRWRDEDRARMLDSRKGKRTLPESRQHPNCKIIAVSGAMLSPVAEFPTSGAYVVTASWWEGHERREGWRYVADAAALDEFHHIAQAAE